MVIFSCILRLVGKIMSRRKRNKETEILATEREILHVEEKILHELHELSHHRTASISLHFTGASQMNSLSLTVGQSSIGTITPLLADGVTPSGGAVSAASFSLPPDPSITAVDNNDGTITITGIAVSAAPVSGTASATVTDVDGAVSTFTTSFTIIVAASTAPPPVATTASIAVSFSTPA